MVKQTILFLLISGFCRPVIGQVTSDVIYRFNDEPLACVISDVTEEEIRYKALENENGPEYALEKDKALLVFKENGDFLLPYGDQSTWVSGADHDVHKIITKARQIYPARILEVQGKMISYQDYSSQRYQEINTDDVLLVIHKDGRHTLFAPMIQVVEGLHQIAQKMEDYAISASEADEVSPTEIIELTAKQEAYFVNMAEVKASDFGKYLQVIADKEEAEEDKLYAIEAACKLFISDSSKIEVSSVNLQKKRQYPVFEYLDRLRMLPYDHIELTWIQAQMVCGLRPGLDGKYYGVIAAQQLFRGYLDNKLVYQDVTDKNMEVVLTRYEVFDEGIKKQKWDVFLSDVGVQQTREK